MAGQDRFRGQDVDNEFSHEDYAGYDEPPRSKGYDETQDQGGRMPDDDDFMPEAGDYHGEDEYAGHMDEGVRTRRPGEVYGGEDFDDDDW